MSDILEVDLQQYRRLVAIRYLNASEAIYDGLKRQRGVNDFHFLVTLRSFIEYSRRGIWFLVWAPDEELKKAENLTFDNPGSPSLASMDEMVNEALGNGKVSPLKAKLPGINESFLNCLHALTHGNPISVRLTTFGLDKIFNTEGLLARAELELNIFRVLVYRRMLGEEMQGIWAILAAIHKNPGDVKVNAMIAADLLKKSGKTAAAIGYPTT
jgi:hypothetical protein